MRIYLCGPMSGYPQFNFPRFRLFAKMLRALGQEVISPAELDEKEDKFDGNGDHPNPDYSHFMSRDLPLVATANAIFMMKGWEKSRGARAEVACAIACKNLLVEEWHTDNASHVLRGLSVAEPMYINCIPFSDWVDRLAKQQTDGNPQGA